MPAVDSGFTPFFFAAYACAFACAFALYWYAVVAGRVAFTLPKVLALGLFLRILLLPMPPGDDMARYVWEGRVLAAGENPYRLAPSDPALVPLRDSGWRAINHKDIPAIYPPLALGLFASLAGLASLASLHPSPYLFKSAFILLDILGLLALAYAIKAPSRPFLGNREGTAHGAQAQRAAQVAGVYFLNPLLILESAGQGHFESLPLLFSLGFLAVLLRPPQRPLQAHPRLRKALAAALCLTLAALSKVSALILLPALILAVPGPAGVVSAFAAAGAVLAGLGVTGSWETLLRFASDFRYNDAVPYLIRSALGGWLPAVAVRVATLLIFVGAGLLLLSRLRGAAPASLGLACMGLLLAFSPTLHPWYALWILPFAAPSLSRPWLLFTGTVAAAYWAYAAAQASGQFREIAWLRLPEFLAPLMLAAWPLLHARMGTGIEASMTIPRDPASTKARE